MGTSALAVSSDLSYKWSNLNQTQYAYMCVCRSSSSSNNNNGYRVYRAMLSLLQWNQISEFNILQENEEHTENDM